MGKISAKTVSESTVFATITRADGSVEHLGMISFKSRNPLKRCVYRLGQFLGIWRR